MSKEKEKWLNASSLNEIVNMGPELLRNLAKEGKIRSVKFGKTAQSRRLYCLNDVLDLLERKSNAGWNGGGSQ